MNLEDRKDNPFIYPGASTSYLGIRLRDHIATEWICRSDNRGGTESLLADRAYKIADAMLVARAKNNE